MKNTDCELHEVSKPVSEAQNCKCFRDKPSVSSINSIMSGCLHHLIEIPIVISKIPRSPEESKKQERGISFISVSLFGSFIPLLHLQCNFLWSALTMAPPTPQHYFYCLLMPVAQPFLPYANHLSHSLHT